jgi:hypothetical protein
LVIVTVEPAIEQPPLATIETVRPDVEVPVAENVAPYTRGVVGCAKVMVWLAPITVSASEPDVRALVVAVIPRVPTTPPVTVRVATPLTAATEPTPVTEPVPLVIANVTLAVENAPVSTMLPAASMMVAVRTRVCPYASDDVTVWVRDIWVAVRLIEMLPSP